LRRHRNTHRSWLFKFLLQGTQHPLLASTGTAHLCAQTDKQTHTHTHTHTHTRTIESLWWCIPWRYGRPRQENPQGSSRANPLGPSTWLPFLHDTLFPEALEHQAQHLGPMSIESLISFKIKRMQKCRCNDESGRLAFY